MTKHAIIFCMAAFALALNAGNLSGQSAPEASSSRSEAAPDCKKETPATVPATEVGETNVYGEQQHAIPTRSVRHPSSFSTTCAVPISQQMPPAEECVPKKADKIDFSADDMEMAIDASYHMTLKKRGAGRVVDRVKMKPRAGDFLVGDSTKFKRRYFVVFHDSLNSGPATMPLNKTYWLLVFYQNQDGTYACKGDMPGAVAHKGGSGQGGVGGGTEPGH